VPQATMRKSGEREVWGSGGRGGGRRERRKAYADLDHGRVNLFGVQDHLAEFLEDLAEALPVQLDEVLHLRQLDRQVQHALCARNGKAPHPHPRPAAQVALGSAQNVAWYGCAGEGVWQARMEITATRHNAI